MSVSVLTIRALVAELARRGCGFDDLLCSVGLSSDTLHDSLLRVDIHDFDRLVDQAFARAGDLTLGLEAGVRAPMTALSVLGPMLLAADTLRSALATLPKYLPLLVQGAEWQISEAADTAVLTYQSPPPRGPGMRFCVEYAFAMAVRIGKALSVGRPIRHEVRFAHGAPPDTRPYAQLFECPVQFGASDNAIVMPRSRMDRPQLHGDAMMQRALKPVADQFLSTLAGSQVADRVRAHLRNQPDLTGLTAANVAAHLRFTARTMRRRLTEEDTSFTRVIDEVRKERGLSELAMPEASVKEVAARLGFSTTSAFHRAFQRWTGQTPARYARASRYGGAHPLA